MKKRVRKLELHRETVGNLGRKGISRVAGGGDTNEIYTGCACTDGCNTGYWCGTAYGCTGGPSAGCPGITNEIMSGCATNCG